VTTLWDYDWDGAREAFRRDVELNPGYATAHVWRAFFLAVTEDDLDRVIAAARRAVDVDPLAFMPQVALAQPLLASGRAEAAVTELETVLENNPERAFAVSKEVVSASGRAPIPSLGPGRAPRVAGPHRGRRVDPGRTQAPGSARADQPPLLRPSARRPRPLRRDVRAPGGGPGGAPEPAALHAPLETLRATPRCRSWSAGGNQVPPSLLSSSRAVGTLPHERVEATL